MIQVNKLDIGYNGRMLIKGARFRLENGRLTAMIGRNGAGKSTLLKAMAGLNNRYLGEIEVDNNNLRQMSVRERAERIAFVNTERVRVSNLRCRDIVGMGRAPYTGWTGRLSERDSEIIEDSMHMCGVEMFADRSMDTMSDGECQRVMISRALAQDTQNLMLDEPTSFLDVTARFSLVTLLRELAHDMGKCVVYSTHELDLALSLSDDIILIADGEAKLYCTSELAGSGIIEDKFEIHSMRSGRVCKK